MNERSPPARSASEIWPGRIERIAAAVVAGGLTLLPHLAAWDYGGVLPWTRYWVCVAIGILAVLAVPLILLRRQLRGWESLGLPIVSLIIWSLALAQTMPLGSEIVRWLSPASASAYTQWVPEAIWQQVSSSPDATVAAAHRQNVFPVSVCGWLTWQALTEPALFGLASFLAVFAFQRRRAMLWLMSATAIAGGLVAFLGMVDLVRATAPGADGTLVTPEVFNAAPFGPFVNKNNAAYYLNLSLGCTLGLLVWRISRQRMLLRDDASYMPPVVNRWAQWRQSAERLLRAADASTVGLSLLGVLLFVGVLASGSRGGFLAALAGIAVCMLASRQRSRWSWSILPLLVGAIAATALLDHLNLTEPTRRRVESIFTLEEGSQVGRLAHWTDSLDAAASYLPAGAGLGTYRFAYLPFSQASAGGWFVHADNMPLEWLVEGGLWLIACVLLGIFLLVRALKRLQPLTGTAHLNGVMTTGWFVLSASCVSQSFDFGLLLPANYLTLACLTGAVFAATARPRSATSVARRSASYPDPHNAPSVAQRSASYPGQHAFTRRSILNNAPPPRPSFLLQRLAVPSLILIFAGVWLMTLRWTGLAADADYQLALLRSEAATRTEPLLGGASPFVQLAVAESILTSQRTQAIQQAPPALSISQRQHYPALSRVEARRAVFHEQKRRGHDELDPAAILLPGQSIAELRRAGMLAAGAMVRCPFSVRARHVRLTTGFALGDSEHFTQRLISQSVQLRPKSPAVLQRIARLALAFPGDASAAAVVAHILADQPDQLAAMWPLIEAFSSERAISAALPDDPDLLIRVVESKPLSETVRAQLIQRASRLLQENESGIASPRRSFLLGQLAELTGRLAAAEAAFADAVRLNPSETEYRRQYAAVLEASGKTGEAIKQLQRILLQDPDNARVRTQLHQLNRRQ